MRLFSKYINPKIDSTEFVNWRDLEPTPKQKDFLMVQGIKEIPGTRLETFYLIVEICAKTAEELFDDCSVGVVKKPVVDDSPLIDVYELMRTTFDCQLCCRQVSNDDKITVTGKGCICKECYNCILESGGRDHESNPQTEEPKQ